MTNSSASRTGTGPAPVLRASSVPFPFFFSFFPFRFPFSFSLQPIPRIKGEPVMTPRQRARIRRHPRSRFMLERLEDRLAPALATADVLARFQDTVVDPPAVTGPLVAETEATTGPTLGRTVVQARAEVLGPVRAFSQV